MYLDLRDLHDELEALLDLGEDRGEEDNERLDSLQELFDQIEGVDDEPTLIDDAYWVEYAQELAEEIGAIPAEYSWPTSCIDWEQAAEELQMDYTPVEFEGRTYWRRI